MYWTSGGNFNGRFVGRQQQFVCFPRNRNICVKSIARRRILIRHCIEVVVPNASGSLRDEISSNEMVKEVIVKLKYLDKSNLEHNAFMADTDTPFFRRELVSHLNGAC